MESEKSYWDVELKKSKFIPEITKFIECNDGDVTDTFDHEGAGIYLLRVFMTKELADTVALKKGVKIVEKPPRYKGMLERNATKKGD
jgi:hypothetical protein